MTSKLLFRELPYLSVSDIVSYHGQFNNDISNSLPTKKYLDKLSSLYDLDLFSLNIQNDINPNSDLFYENIKSHYYSPHSFNLLKNKLPRNESNFSLLHNNVRSLRRNLENLQVHLLDELNYSFSVIGVSETKISTVDSVNFDTSIPGYKFEYVPTPLASGGVGMYVKDSLNYTIIDKTSNEAFQALWIEFHLSRQPNIICGVVYRQHNSPQQFLDYFDETLEKFSALNKPIFIMGDFNINLLAVETCNYAHKFLLSLQSYSLIPTVDKPTRVYNNSATLIDNIFVNKLDSKIKSGNIVSDISDHYSQFCIVQGVKVTAGNSKILRRDYSQFSEHDFLAELAEINWDTVITTEQGNINRSFSTFYNKVNKVVGKHAPMKTLSRRKAKQLSKPWITRGIRKSIRVKNSLYLSGNKELYRIYRNKILNISRESKKIYFHKFFSDNLYNMKLTWAGINDLINRGKKKSRRFSSVRCPTSGDLTYDPKEITNVFNKHFSSVGHRLASNLPPSNRHFSEYLRGNYEKSFFFDPVTPTEIEREILSIPLNKAHGLYSCPNRILRSARYILSYPLAKLMNLSVTSGEYPSKLKHAKVIPVYKDDDETDPANYRPISLLSNYNRIFEKIMFNRLKAFIDKKEILYRSQYGFRDKHSTQHAILEIVNSLQRNMDNKLFSCGIFIDLKKAFDNTQMLKKIALHTSRIYPYSPTEGIGISWEVGGSARPKNLRNV